MHPKRVGRLPGFEYKGCFSYFLTLCTFGRRPRFSNARIVAETDRIFRKCTATSGFQILGYCYMPDHLHLVLSGVHRDADLVVCVQDAKQQSGCWHAQRYRMPLWQTGWFDHIIGGDESIERHVCYTLANPVRAGLVDGWRQWPYSGTTRTGL